MDGLSTMASESFELASHPVHHRAFWPGKRPARLSRIGLRRPGLTQPAESRKERGPPRPQGVPKPFSSRGPSADWPEFFPVSWVPLVDFRLTGEKKQNFGETSNGRGLILPMMRQPTPWYAAWMPSCIWPNRRREYAAAANRVDHRARLTYTLLNAASRQHVRLRRKR